MGNRFVNFGLLLVASWIVMTMSHEVGHLVGGWAGGGTLSDFDLAPGDSRTASTTPTRTPDSRCGPAP